MWLGTLGYLLYQAVLFCFATPLNSLFLCYVAYLGLAVWSIVTLFPAVDQHAFGCRLSTGMPARFLAVFALAITAMNAAVWLSAIVPALLELGSRVADEGHGIAHQSRLRAGSGDLAAAPHAAAVGCWHRRAWGLLVTGAMLVMFTLEGIGVATDQWFGSRADPSSPAASMMMVPAFAALAVVTGSVLALYLYNIDRSVRPECER